MIARTGSIRTFITCHANAVARLAAGELTPLNQTPPSCDPRSLRDDGGNLSAAGARLSLVHRTPAADPLARRLADGRSSREAHKDYRRRELPRQLDRTRAKLARLLAKADRLRMYWLTDQQDKAA
jgi:hypothetical protein